MGVLSSRTRRRITFTFPVINSSANVALVVAGAEKADAVNVVLGDGQNSEFRIGFA